MKELFEKSFTPLTPDFLKSLEQGMGIKFPLDYQKFLLTVNGGEPYNTSFSIQQIPDNSLIDRFFGVVPEKSSNLLFYRSLYQGRVPSNTLPIARDQLGNLILMSIKGQDYKKVYFWDHNWEAEDDHEPDYSNMYLLSNSFEEFLENLQPDEA